MAERKRRAKAAPSPLDEAFADTLRAIRRRNNLGRPAPMLRGISEAQAEKVREYVASLGRDPDRLERVAYNAILDAAVAKHWREVFRNENARLRAENERLRGLIEDWGRKGSTPHPLKRAVVRAMADAILADPPPWEDCPPGGRLVWPTEKKRRFTRELDLEALNTKRQTYNRPSEATMGRWWREAEALAYAERLRAENEALDRLTAEIDWGDAAIRFE
jgi:hypothetical protein